jgi:hypothetical protein
MMKKITKFGIEFLLLALRIDKHIKGYIDFYFGPEKLRQIVDNESITSPNKLLIDCKVLIRQLGAQGYDKKRERYIEKMLIAMKTSIELLNGVEMSIKDQFLRQYDVALQPVNESELDNLKEEFNAAYGGLGSLEKRMNDLRVRRTVPEGKVFELFKNALNITRERTKELFIDLLPENERVNLELVKNKNTNVAKWAYYNWYLGNFCSRIELNPNYNMYWTAYLSAVAHEGYPGHHTEFVVKEQRLYRELNQFEHSILLLNSPKLIICEGIANTAVNMLFDYWEQAEISLREFCQDSSKESSIEALIAQGKVKGKQSLFGYNFAYHALIDGWSEEKLIQYATSFEIFSQEIIKNRIKYLLNPVHSTTAFSYNIGSKLIINKYGGFPSVKDFRDLLINPILPSDLV